MTNEWEFAKGRVPQGVARRGSRIYKGLLLLTSRAHSIKCELFNRERTRIQAEKWEEMRFNTWMEVDYEGLTVLS